MIHTIYSAGSLIIALCWAFYIVKVFYKLKKVEKIGNDLLAGLRQLTKELEKR
jgi:hypothetical protein